MKIESLRPLLLLCFTLFDASCQNSLQTKSCFLVYTTCPITTPISVPHPYPITTVFHPNSIEDAEF